MNAEVTNQFESLRRALKVCSFAFLAISVFQVFPVLVSVGRTGTIFADFAGAEKLPVIFNVANALRDNILILGLVFLLILAGALTVTIRSKGGLFLYVNLGLSLLIWTSSTCFLMSAQELLRIPLEKLYE